MSDDEVEVKLELHTHSGISREDMLDAMGRYLDEGAGFVYSEDDGRGYGRLTSTVGVITAVDLEGDELTATVRLMDPKTFWAARTVQALCEAKRTPALSPIGYGGEPGRIEKVTSVVVRPPAPVKKESDRGQA